MSQFNYIEQDFLSTFRCINDNNNNNNNNIHNIHNNHYYISWLKKLYMDKKFNKNFINFNSIVLHKECKVNFLWMAVQKNRLDLV